MDTMNMHLACHNRLRLIFDDMVILYSQGQDTTYGDIAEMVLDVEHCQERTPITIDVTLEADDAVTKRQLPLHTVRRPHIATAD